MIRTKLACLALALSFTPVAHPQSDSLEGYFTGKEVLIKIDMPGTQKGVDLKFSNPTPMNWNDYSSRLKQNGVAIHKGDIARITKIVVKKDNIEFQLDGGGYGTVRDDTNTTIAPTVVGESDYEKSLENQIANTSDPDKLRSLQRELDRERARRDRVNAANQSDAQIASQIKAQQVADNRLNGGSRFNLRWQGSIPPDARNPDAIMKLLADYVDFNPPPAAGPPPPPGQYPGIQNGAPSGSQLRQGMSLDEVMNLLGPGRLLSESVGQNGLKTQVFEFNTPGYHANVTCVNGVVVQYNLSAN